MPGVPEAATKALVPEARYQADYAGLARASAAAYEQPELPENWGKGEVMAAEAWGKALSNLGGDMMELANQSAKARNYADLEEARDYMQNETLRYEQWRLENPDTDGWQAEWQRRVTATQKYFAEKRYAPVVRGQVERDVNQFGERGLIQAGIDAAKVQFSRAGAAIQTARGRAVQQRSIQGVAEAGGQAVALGIESQKQADENTRQAVSDIHATARHEMIHNNPAQVLEWAKNPNGKDVPEEFQNQGPSLWRRVTNTAKAALYHQQRQIMEDIRGALAAGPVVKQGREQEWLDAHVPPGLRSGEIAELITTMQAGDPTDLAKVNRARDEVRSHNPLMADAEVEQARLRMRNALYPEDIRDELDTLLDKVVQRKRAEPVALQAGRRLILNMHEKEQLTDGSGEPLRYRGEGFLFEALGDENKTRVFGLKGWASESLRRIRDPKQRIQRFHDLMSSRRDFGKVDIDDEEGHAAMSNFTKRLFDWGLYGGPDFTDLPSRNASAARAEQLIQELENYYSHNLTATTDQLLTWVAGQTSQARLLAGLRAIRRGDELAHQVNKGSVTMTPEGTAIIKPPHLRGDVDKLLSE